MPVSDTPKAPPNRFARAGKAGAAVRWGEHPRVVRLDTLSQAQRAVVISLIEAHKSANKALETRTPAEEKASVLEVSDVHGITTPTPAE